MFDSLLHGLAVRSALALPGVAQALNGFSAPSTDLPPVRIRTAPVPAALRHGATGGVMYEATPEEVLIRLPSGPRLLLRGEEVVVQLEEKAAHPAVQLCLLNVALPLVLHRLQRLVLHAAGIAAHGRGVALLGPSGAGKSTLAMAFGSRGDTVLSDEVVALRPSEEGAAEAYPGPRCLQLWHDVLAHGGCPVETTTSVRPGLEKYFYPLPALPHEARPIRTIFVLEEAFVDRVTVEPMARKDILRALLQHTHRYEYLAGMGLLPAHAALCARLALSLQGYRLVWPRGRTLDLLEPLCETIEQVAAA